MRAGRRAGGRQGKRALLEQGLYGLDYTAAMDQPEIIGSGLLLLRGRRIIGTDRCGGVFIGAIDHDRRQHVSRVSIRMNVPPGGELVNGVAAGTSGATIDIEAALDASRNTMTVDVAGRPVTVKLTYIGPLPN